jgi:hypothetical protein
MIRKFTRTITIDVEYTDPYLPNDNAWDAMREYSPEEMAREISNESLSSFFSNTQIDVIDDEVTMVSQSEGPWCGQCNKPLDTGDHDHGFIERASSPDKPVG